MIKKGIIRLYPTVGKVVEGCFVNHNNKIYKVIEIFDDNSITLDDGTKIMSYECRLLKYYLVWSKNIAEVHYSEYNKVELDKKYSADVTSIENTANIGDSVTIFKLDCSTIGFNKSLRGIIVNINLRKYEIELIDGTKVFTKRHYFRLIDKSNTKFVARIIEADVNTE